MAATLFADPSTFGPGKGPAPGQKQEPLAQAKSTKFTKKPANLSQSAPDKGAKLITTFAEGKTQTEISIVNFKGVCGSTTKVRTIAPNSPVEVTEMKVCERVYFYFLEDGWISGENLKVVQ